MVYESGTTSLGSNTSIERLSLAEGFADHNVLRYAIYRMVEKQNRSHDSAFPIPNYATNYFADFEPTRYVIEQQFSNGEAVPVSTYSGVGGNDMIFTPWETTDPCSAAGFSGYDCGKLISTIYWSLVWNEVRVGYYGEIAGTSIIDTSIGWLSPAITPNTDGTAERLANIAFTYAILSLPGNPDLLDFFDRVSERYLQFLIDGSITADEFARVAAVIGVHCVGWDSDHCQSLHRTAWQDLPVAHTVWAAFQNTTPPTREEFFRAEDAIHIGLVVNKSHGTPDGLGYEVLLDPGAEICERLTFLDDGTFKIHVAARADPSSNGELEVTIYPVNGVPSWFPWTLDVLDGSWRWYHDSPHFQEVQEGENWVCLRSTDELDVDALLVRQVGP